MQNTQFLVTRCQQGQLDAFGELFDLYRHRVFDIAYAILRDGMAAEDMTQDTFLIVFQKIDSYEGQSTFETWLVAIVVNRCRSHLRKRQIRNNLSLESLTANRLFGRNSRGEDVADLIHKRQQRQVFWDVVDRLDDRLRLPLILRYRYGFSCDDIAIILGKRKTTIYQYLSEARTHLKQVIQQQETTSKEISVELVN